MNCTEFDAIRNAAGSNNFVFSVKAWIQRTGAIRIMAKAGRYGGTYAHRDIAYQFEMWISPRSSINELIYFSNMENLNAVFISDGIGRYVVDFNKCHDT